ncbi:MAG: hypothetical protein IPM54_06145 [Polyangiaceae bacterium]|nr:hypothetical protein [Polyangiaceae bacterium]
MENKVGDKPPSAEEAADLLAKAKDLATKLKVHGITLTVDDRKRTLRPRRGADVHVQRVVELAAKYGVALPNIPLAGMSNDLLLARQYQPIEDELRVALQIAEDTGTQAGSEAWEAFLAYYGVLSSMAQRMPDLAAELQPVADFMARGPRKKAT